MRLSTFILILLFLAPALASAQTTIGVKAQTGKAWMSVPEGWVRVGFDDRIPHWGYSIEVFKPLNRHLSLGVAPGYMRRGTAFEIGFINGFGPRFISMLHLNYVQLPFYLKLEKKLIGRIAGYVQSGVGLSYLVDGYRIVEMYNVSDPPPIQNRPLDFSDDGDGVHRLDLGWHNSAGFTIRIGPGNLLLSADYYHGYLQVSQRRPVKNRNWAMGLGYVYRLGEN